MFADEPGPDEHPRWRLLLLDLDYVGDWSWDLDVGTLVQIVNFLREMERLSWAEVRAQMAIGKKRGDNKHKFIPIEHLCTAAQRRLAGLEYDDFDQLFRFRLGNMERLWGLVHDGTFYVIWWDPDHKVCPGKDQ